MGKYYLAQKKQNFQDNEAVTFTETVKAPEKWSAETPNLYTLVMTIELDGKIICVKTYKVGFKR